MRSRTLCYQNPRSAQTLSEGLAEYQRALSMPARDKELHAQSRAFFRLRDRCHVLFGCATSVREEAMTDAWILLGTTMSTFQYLSCLQPRELMVIYQQTSLLATLWATLMSAPEILEVARCARLMRHKWPFHHNDHFLNKPLCVLRDAFNIQLVAPQEFAQERDRGSTVN